MIDLVPTYISRNPNFILQFQHEQKKYFVLFSDSGVFQKIVDLMLTKEPRLRRGPTEQAPRVKMNLVLETLIESVEVVFFDELDTALMALNLTNLFAAFDTHSRVLRVNLTSLLVQEFSRINYSPNKIVCHLGEMTLDDHLFYSVSAVQQPSHSASRLDDSFSRIVDDNRNRSMQNVEPSHFEHSLFNIKEKMYARKKSSFFAPEFDIKGLSLYAKFLDDYSSVEAQLQMQKLLFFWNTHFFDVGLKYFTKHFTRLQNITKFFFGAPAEAQDKQGA